jgi:hypothetical protein
MGGGAVATGLLRSPIGDDPSRHAFCEMREVRLAITFPALIGFRHAIEEANRYIVRAGHIFWEVVSGRRGGLRLVKMHKKLLMRDAPWHKKTEAYQHKSGSLVFPSLISV